MINFLELWFLVGCLSAFYMFMDVKYYEKRPIDDIDYIIFFFYIASGLIGFAIVIVDICIKEWWHK